MNKLQSLASLYQEREFYSSEELEKILNINQSELKTLIADTIKSDNGCIIEVVKGKGYKLVVYDTVKFRKELLNVEEKQSSDEKIRLNLIDKLMQSNDYINVNKLLNEFFISRTKFNNIIDDINKVLKDFHLQVIYTPYKGISLQGIEIDIRHFMINYYTNTSLGLNGSNLYFSIVDFFKMNSLKIPSKNYLNKVCRILKVILIRNDKNFSFDKFKIEEVSKIAIDLLAYLEIELNEQETAYFSGALNYYVFKTITEREEIKIKADITWFLKNYEKMHAEFTRYIEDDVFEILKNLYLNNKYIYLYYFKTADNKVLFLDDVIRQFLNKNTQYYMVYNYNDLAFISNLVAIRYKMYKKNKKFLKIALIEANTLLKNEYHIEMIKEALTVNHQIEIFSEFDQENIIKYNPNLIITSHLIPDILLKHIKQFRTINIKRSYTELKSEDIRNYILSYDFIQLINTEVNFARTDIPEYIFKHESLHFDTYYIDSDTSFCNIDLQNNTIVISKSFINTSYTHTLLIDEIIRITEQESSLNSNDIEFKLFLINRFKTS